MWWWEIFTSKNFEKKLTLSPFRLSFLKKLQKSQQELAHIAANKNTVPGDVSALVPGGLRMGSPALTSRGFVEADFDKVAEFVDRGCKITADIKKSGKAGTKLKEFREYVDASPPAAIDELAAEVEDFAKQWPTIGFEKSGMRYQE